jgi:hypothetical protein
LKPFVGVQVQQVGSSPADSRLADNYCAATLEMFLPRLTSGMEYLGQRPCFRIVAGHVAPFVQIAVNASQRKIVKVVTSAMFSWKNMLDMQSGQRRLVLMQSAILASEVCPAANLTSHGGVHAG